MKKLKLICNNCGREFISIRNKKTCSDVCRKELRKKKNSIYYAIKKCECCGNEFMSKIKENKKYCSYKCSGISKKTSSREIRVCAECGKEFEERIKYSKKLCSKKCRDAWALKYENKKARIDKSKSSLLLKYGVDSIFKVAENQKQFAFIRNNSNNCSNIGIKTIENNRKKKLIDRFSEIGYKIIKFNEDESITVMHPDGHIFSGNRKILVNRLNHNTELSTQLLPISASRSTLELKIAKFLDECSCGYTTNDRNLLKNYEIDILIENKKLAIELNGLFWHSEYYLNSDYHLNKLDNCNKIGYSLIQFYEDEIIEKFDIVKSIIKNKLKIIDNKIYARKCVIREIDSSTSAEFLNRNHLQGNINAKIRLGLYYNNELVSLMTFGKKRIAMGNKNNINGEYEMLRFCNKLNTLVIGGASKLLNYFIKSYSPKSILSFADRRYSNGKLYEKLGFIHLKNTAPNYWYVLNKKREYRFKFRKDVLVKQGFDAQKTEHQIMLDRNIPRIYDCGNMKFIYEC